MMHEHILNDLTPLDLAARGGPEAEITLENVFAVRYSWGVDHLGNHRLRDEAVAVAELRRFKAQGGSAIVELTCAGMAPQPEALRRIAEAADLHIVAGCGFYTEEYMPAGTAGRSTDAMAAEIVAALTRGIAGTTVKAGLIGEVGCSWPWTELERRSMQAAVLAQQQTGATISIHPGRAPEAPLQIAEFVRAAGGDLGRTVLGHIDRTIFDAGTLLRLADTGCVVEYDFFGIESAYYPFSDIDMPNDAVRLRALRSLIEAGHGERIVVSQDICTRTRLQKFGGHGYGHILENVIPMMRRRGFSEAEIATITVETPRRLLARA